MEKWADYLISAVKYKDKEMHIDKALCHEDQGDKVGSPQDVSRAEIVKELGSGVSFATVTKASDGKWSLEANVRSVTVDGVKYIRTDADQIKGMT